MKAINITNVKYRAINGYDNLYFTVDDFKGILQSKPVVDMKKEFLENGIPATLFVKIWDCGIAQYGLTLKKDPLHGNKEYTWSSNAETINMAFNLWGTKYQIARYGAGIADTTEDNGYWAGNLTTELAMKIATENQDKLNYGLEEYKKTIGLK